MKTDATSLDRLHDIVTPTAIPWWPPAPGWYWVLGFFSLVAAGLLVRWLLHWQHNRYRREALAELALQEGMLRDPAKRATALGAVAELLKRVALTAFPRRRVATLTGKAWFDFLDRTGRTTCFAQGRGTILEDATYDPRSAANLDDQKLNDVMTMARDWIKHHNREFEQESIAVQTSQGQILSTATNA
jgi:hypothetical protein